MTVPKKDYSVNFNAAWYLEEYPDVAQLGMDPLEHYLWLGKRLGRRTEPAELWIDPKRRASLGVGVEEAIVWRDTLSTGPSIAATVHVYYDDLIDEVCAYLAHIPYRFSGYFAVRTASMISAIKSSLKRHGARCDPHFVVSPNRGRNFGAFLVEFREAVRAHDLCLHIHTKKSLRMGEEQRDWRGHLFDGLLGDRTTVATILTRFVEDPRVGLLFPTTYAGMPVWCHHWLRTSGRVDEISHMLGISGMPRRGLIDFPIGSMFWARTDAIAPLLDFAWQYDHFETEPMDDDGTMAHVIERMMGGLCSTSGFDYLEMSAQENIFRRNWSEKLLHHHLEAWDDACQKAHNCDVMSFDFYDTLFCRQAFTPDDVHNYIGWALQVRGAIAEEGMFYTARKAAEDHARAYTGKGDVTLDDIYQSFSATTDWSQAAISLAHKLEWEIEARCLIPRSDMIELVRIAKDNGTRVIVVSDSYMPRRFFEEVLAQHGIDDLFDEIHVSSEVGLRKDRGDIWPWIKTNEAEGHRFYHVGDNEYSDIQNPLREALGNIYVINTTMLAQLCGLGPLEDWRVKAPAWRDGILHGPVVARLCNDAFLHRDGYRPIHLDSPRSLGYAVWGPLIFGFLTWVIDQARQKEQRVFFLAREGWFLVRLYEQIRSALGQLDIDLPEGQYLMVSRRSTMGPMAAVDFDPDFIVRGPRFQGTLNELLKARLGVDLGAGVPEVAYLIDTEQDRAKAAALVKRMEKRIVEAMGGPLERLRGYLAQEGADQRGGLIVDIGYSGTIQSALQTITGTAFQGAYMVTSQAASSVKEQGGSATGYFSHDYAPSVVRDYSMLLESVLTAPHGPTVDYQNGAEKIEPIFGLISEAQRHFSYIEQQFEGVTDYFSDILRTYGPEIALTTFSPRECEMGLRQLLDGVLKPPSDFAKKLSVENDFCGEGEIDIGQFYKISAK
ncbi:MAG TPA: rhamnan synthesis F family protein [Sphingobium sp.]|uniref:rhamnan synthesis F family protein n=1 Tax=Sphingobium sp. TaxID=1912891 RepID=UPI002ED50871